MISKKIKGEKSYAEVYERHESGNWCEHQMVLR